MIFDARAGVEDTAVENSAVRSLHQPPMRSLLMLSNHRSWHVQSR
jgi:hypothetical protein